MIFDPPRVRPLGDHYVSVEFGDDANLESSFRGLALSAALDGLDVPGVIETYVTLPNVAVIFDPNQVRYRELEEVIGETLVASEGMTELPSRLITMPIWYDDPWSAQVARRYEVENNFEFVAATNGLSPEELVEFHSGVEHWVVFVGFVPGVNLHYPLDRDRRLTAPKYKTPRTFTPSRCVALAGVGTCQYSLPSPGGYQMLGRLAIDIYQPNPRTDAFDPSGVLLRPGDRIKYRSVGALEYEEIWNSVVAGTYEYEIVEESFDVAGYLGER